MSWIRPPGENSDALDLLAAAAQRRLTRERLSLAWDDWSRRRPRAGVLDRIGWRGRRATMANVAELIAKLRKEDQELARLVEAVVRKARADTRAVLSHLRDEMNGQVRRLGDDLAARRAELQALDAFLSEAGAEPKPPKRRRGKREADAPRKGAAKTAKTEKAAAPADGRHGEIAASLRRLGGSGTAAEITRDMLANGYEDPGGRDEKKLVKVIGVTLALAAKKGRRYRKAKKGYALKT